MENIVRAVEHPETTDWYALERLTTRQDWLRNRGEEEAHTLSFHVVHGDYQETNVFFKDGEVSAIIDWDKVYKAPGAWEIIRTIHLMLSFHPDLTATFLKAYRSRRDVSLDDLDVAAHSYGLMRAYDLWLFENIYDAGNDRVRKFLHPGSFRPLERDWKQIRSSL